MFLRVWGVGGRLVGFLLGIWRRLRVRGLSGLLITVTVGLRTASIVKRTVAWKQPIPTKCRALRSNVAVHSLEAWAAEITSWRSRRWTRSLISWSPRNWESGRKGRFWSWCIRGAGDLGIRFAASTCARWN